MIIDRLIDRIKELENPTVVGLDPRVNFIPDFITEKYYKKYGYTPKAVAKSMYKFNKCIIDEFVILYQLLSHRLQCTKDTALRV